MLNTIYAIQAKLAAQGTSIDHILVLLLGFIFLIIVVYLVKYDKRDKLNNGV